MHTHHHGHEHSHSRGSHGSAFAIGIVLNVSFVCLEAGYGFAANSLALLADAAHNLSDVAALGLAWGAAWLGQQRPTVRRTYGYRRASILAAATNAALLLIVVGGILVESVRRFQNPEPIAGATVMWVAGAGIAINGLTALLFMRDRHADLNIRGAFLHMAADAAVSLGVVVAALIVQATDWLWLDPAVSIAIGVVILYGTWALGRESLNLAFDAIPAGIEPDQVTAYLLGLPGVIEVHDLHIWAMSTTETALTAHLVRPGTGLDDALIAEAGAQLAQRFGVHHATLQVESGDPSHPCRLASAEVV